jgi:putative PIN family toxin of toxin-antitoxin system
MRVVVGTDVFVARLLSPVGAPARVFDLWEAQAFDLVVSEPILAEYARVLSYPHLAPRLQLGATAIAALIAALRQLAILVEPTEPLTVLEGDPANNRFLECAVAGVLNTSSAATSTCCSLPSTAASRSLPPATFATLLAGHI